MLAKRFFFTSAGIFLLAIAYSVNSARVGAQAMSHVFAVDDVIENGGYVLRSDGQIFRCDGLGVRPENYWPSPPVPLSQIRHWSVRFSITHSGDVWLWEDTNGWQMVGTVPPPVVGIENKSWSGAKQGFRK